MKKPEIIRLKEDEYFPQKENYRWIDIMRYFVDTNIVVMEKFDGKAHFDNEHNILFEDLHDRGKDHIIKYTSDKFMILAFLHKGNWFPMVSEWYEALIDFEEDGSRGSLAWDLYDRYPKFMHHKPLFRGRVTSQRDFWQLINIMLQQRSQWDNNQNNRMEGLVIYSVEHKKWGKIHNEWFSKLLSDVEN